MKPLLKSILLPDYRVDAPPDFQQPGRVLDSFISEHFPEGSIALRGISLQDHPDLPLDDLVSIILESGTDRYDPQRKGVLHDFYEPYQVDLHALPCTLTDTLRSTHCQGSVMADILQDFYYGPPQDRNGTALRIDILSIYDRTQLNALNIDYGYENNQESCEFQFKSEDKHLALLGVLKIL